jgi:hypothetical protein
MSHGETVGGIEAPITSALTETQRRILEHLSSRVDGRTYFKSRSIGRELGLSAKEVGSNMGATMAGE